MSKTKLLEHLDKLIACYPVTDNQDAVLAALEYCRGVLVGTGSFADATLHSSNGFHSLTASTQGTKHPKLLFQAHIDVVPAPKSARKLVINGDTAEGRGTFDMLFAAASYLTLIEEHASQLSKLDIGIMFTGDEELGGFNGVKYLLDNGYSGDICILPDAGDGWGELSVSAKGVYNFDLIVNGKAHHSSRPWEGDGAANKLVLLMNDLVRAFENTNRLDSTLTITRLKSGDADNKAPADAQTHIDVRYKDAKDYERIRQLITEVAEQNNGQIKNVITSDDYQVDTKNQLFKEFAVLYQKELSEPLRYTNAPGSSDAVFFVAKNIPVIILRPDGSGAHADQELLSIKSLQKFYDLLEAFTLKTAKIN